MQLRVGVRTVFNPLALLMIVSAVFAQDQNFYFGSQPQSRFIPNYQQQAQNDYYQQIPFRQTAPGYQQPAETAFLNQGQRDLQTSDLPRHLQQTLPQYQFTSLEQPQSRFPLPVKSNYPENLRFENTGLSGAQQSRIPAPFRSQGHPTSYSEIIPSTHRPQYSNLLPPPHSSRNHDPSTETFLGEITIQNPVLPEDFNANSNKNSPKFRPSGSFSYQNNNPRLPEDIASAAPSAPTRSQTKWQNIDNTLTKTRSNDINSRQRDSVEQRLEDGKRTKFSNAAAVPSRGSDFINQRTRNFAPTDPQDGRNKVRKNNYFVSNSGEVYNAAPRARSTTPRTTTTSFPITTLSRRNPFAFARTTERSTTSLENKIAFFPRSRTTASTTPSTTTASTTPSTTTTKSSLDLDSLLEEPLDKDSLRSHNDDVEVIEEVKPMNFSDAEEKDKTAEEEEENAEHHEDYDEHDYQADDEEHEHQEHENDEENNINNENNFDTAAEHNDEQEHDDNEENEHTDQPEDSSYEVLTMKPSNMVKDDNFKEFVDTTVIDNTDEPEIPTTTEEEIEETTSRMAMSVSSSVHSEQAPKQEDAILLGGAVVSVVTTKSVVNGTIPLSVTPPPNITGSVSAISLGNSTESWVVVASVQTSRSVSGARYLPFPVVEQEQRTKTLKEQSDEELENEHEDVPTTEPTVAEVTTEDTLEDPTTLETSFKANQSSTESIIDKLDRVQSELSSGFLTGGFNNAANNIALITEGMVEKPEDITTMAPTTTTERNYNILPPVVIRKFSANARKPSTPRPKRIYKFTTPTTTTTGSVPDVELPQGDEPSKQNPTSARTSGISEINKVVPVQDISAFLPPGYNLKKEESTTEITKSLEEILKKIKFQDVSSLLAAAYKPENKTKDPLAGLLPTGYKQHPASTERSRLETKPVLDISHLLPPGFKLTTEGTIITTTEKFKKQEGLLANAQPVDISAFLPPGYKPPKQASATTEKPKEITNILAHAKPVNDISALLPPGYKPPKESSPTASTTEEPKGFSALLDAAKEEDISAFLPPGYKGKYLTKTTPRTTTTEKISIPVLSGLLPEGYRPEEVLKDNSTETISTTSKPTTASSGGFKIVFPSRPGKKPGHRLTTPRSIGGGDGGHSGGGVTPPAIHKGWPSRATTEFTGWPTPSTTPISIEKLLEAARKAAETSSTAVPTTSTTSTTTTTTTTTTIRPTTPGICKGECDLAGTIKLIGGAKWVPELLDHNTQEWQILANEVQTQLEDVFTNSKDLSKWFTKVRIDGFSEGSVLVDYFVELNDLGRQVDTMEFKKLFHESLTAAAAPVSTTASSSREAKSADYTNGSASQDTRPKLGLGNFIVDPMYTDFIVIPKQISPTVGYAEDNVLLPQWAIAVIVIGLASLMFVIIFGVTVLVNRQKNAKKKQPTPLTEDMLNELNKNHMGGIDNFGAEDLYNMEDVWNERAYESSKLPKKRSTGSIHDNSMSNLYDSWKSEWNGYYYNTYYGNNPGSSHSGYSRRRSDYDTNF